MLGTPSSAHGKLSPQIALKLAKAHLENAHRASDPELAAIFYNEARAALSRMEQPTLEALLSSGSDLDQYLGNETQYVASELSEMLNSLEQQNKQTSGVKAGETDAQSISDDLLPSDDTTVADPQEQQVAEIDTAMIPRHIFAENKRPPFVEFTLPEHDERLKDTPQLSYCLGLLQTWRSSPDSILEPAIRKWLNNIDANEDEVERLKTLATDVITTFARDESYDSMLVAEVVCLASVLDKSIYRYLLGQFCGAIAQSSVLDSLQLDGLAQVIRRAAPDYLEAADLIKILRLLKHRLTGIHKLPSQEVYELVLSVSGVLDAMADTSIKGLNQQELGNFLSEYLTGLKATSDHSVVYQAAYAYQALQHIPDHEPIWQAAFKFKRRATSGQPMTEADRALDLNKFIEQLKNISPGTSVKPGTRSQEREQTLQEHLHECCSLEYKQAWYPALRMADALLQDGRFAEFKTLVCEVPCRQAPAFQWGLCQCLKDLAVHPEWDTKTRLNAFALLDEIYRRDDVWSSRDDIKHRISNIFIQLASSFSEPVKQAAEAVIQLKADGDPMDQLVDREFLTMVLGTYPLNAAFLSLATPSLLDRVQDTLGVEGRLRQLRKQRLGERRDTVYVDIQAKACPQVPGYAHFSLVNKAKEFLDSDRKLLLVLGASGSGKSTFAHELEHSLLRSYERLDGCVPLYIDLATVHKPYEDLVTKQLRKTGFSNHQINELKVHRKFILICDGYDQLQLRDNLYTSNKLNQPGGWNAKMVICSRNENLGADYLDHFQPADQNSRSQPELFQQAVIVPFTTGQVHHYIDQYVLLHNPPWNTDDFLQALDQNPCLKDLARNPLLLSLFLGVMPRLLVQGELSTKKFTRVEVYDQIVEQWFEGHKDRLEEVEAFDILASDGFISRGINYLKKLAAAIYRNQDGVSAVEYSRLKDKGTWKEEFFHHDQGSQLLHEAPPLKCCGYKYQFIHPSILEYGLALAVFDPQEVSRIAAPKRTSSRHRSVDPDSDSDSDSDFELDDPDEVAVTAVEQSSDLRSPLSWRNFVGDSSILGFLEERVQQEPLLRQKLMAFIELSKTDKKWRTAATNAITILVGAGIQFNGADLRGIQVPGADLSHGMFDSAQFQGADLRKAILRNGWLYKTDLSQAQMRGAQFGELPFLTEDDGVSSCAYSADGKYFAVGVGNGLMTLYTTSNWEQITTFTRHSNSVTNVAFSPRGNIVSASFDRTVRLWDFETGTCLNSLTAHTSTVNSAVFSPRGDYIASCSSDNTIRVWNVESGECRHILEGHEESVLSVAFSPTGVHVASAGSDKTVRLWDVESAVCLTIFNGHGDDVNSVAYSPHGHLVVTGSDDATVRLWDLETEACRYVLRGHTGWVMSVAFSPQGDTIASGGSDKSVRLWDVETGACQHVFPRYNGWIRAVAFSPNGDQIASGCGDKTVRLWDMKSSIRHHIPNGHIGAVRSVAISPKDGRTASGGDDKTIRLWEFDSGVCLDILRGHKGCVMGIAFSSNGDRIVSGSSDQTVRLWDAGTGVCVQILSGHEREITSIAFSPNGDQIASGSKDRQAPCRLWNAGTSTCNVRLEHEGPVMSVAFSPRGDRIAFGGSNRTIRLWDVGARVFRNVVLDGHTNWIESVMFSPKGDQIVSASHDETVRLWNVSDGACCHVLNGHDAPVTSAVFSSKGDLVASSSDDKTLRLWKVATGQCCAVIGRFQGHVNSLAWTTRSGVEYLATGDEDGLVQLWQVSEDGDGYSVRLSWSSTPLRLNLAGVSVQNVQGLSTMNRRLLNQRGELAQQ
ncbi:hypothetical protein BGX34_010335 [Mortierella sp. NVP85]|nr:hypothetical protein BGX34_010335 [Mortierella sp. NVP85]